MQIRSLILSTLLIYSFIYPVKCFCELNQSDIREEIILKPTENIYLEGSTLKNTDRANRIKSSAGKLTPFSLDTYTVLEQMGIKKGESAYYIVKLKNLSVSNAKKSIELYDAKVLQYVPDASFIVYMSDIIAQKISNIEDVDWIGVYKPEYKFSQSLQRLLRNNLIEKTNANNDNYSEKFIELNIYLFQHSTMDRIKSQIIASKGKILADVSNERIVKIIASLPITKLVELSYLPEVYLIEKNVKPVLHNDKAREIIKIDDTISTCELTGAGEIIGHADTGLDVGMNDSSIHTDFKNKIIAAFPLGRNVLWNDPQGHGTHTAGSILGSGVSSGGKYKGVAPGSMLVHQSLIDNYGDLSGIPADLGTLYQQAFNVGAKIHSNSYGADANGDYSRGRELDAWIWNNGNPQDMLIVYSAGNTGPLGKINSPATAKNCLTVGASENNRPSFGPDSDNPFDIASFSSRGPIKNGRIKPDIIAPGTYIISAKTHAERIVFKEDIETLSNWTFEPMNSPFKISEETARSGIKSINYYQPGNTPFFQHHLVSPFFDYHTPGTLFLRIWVKGNIPDNYLIGAAVRIDKEEWFDIGWVNGTLWNDWTALDWILPQWALIGFDNIQVGIYLYQNNPEVKPLNLFIDDISLSTFNNSEDMWAKGLAQKGDQIDTNYTIMSGSSMSAPLVAGCAALVRQYFDKYEKISPSPELIKSVIVNGATDPTTDTLRPDNSMGYGIVNLKNSLFPQSPRALTFIDKITLIENEIFSYPFSNKNSSDQLRVTLAYSDREGANLQNNLDLRLISPTNFIYYPITSNLKFSKMLINATNEEAGVIFPVDLDDDDDMDFIESGSNGVGLDKFFWWENRNSLNFIKHEIGDSSDRFSRYLSGDLDNDGDIDIIQGNYSFGKISWWENDGNQNFQIHNLNNTFKQCTSLDKADIDQDGDIDIVATSVGLNEVAWFENDNATTFTKHIMDNQFEGATSINALDIDKDGDIDVVACALWKGEIAWWENKNSGLFAKHIIESSIYNPLLIYPTDLDNDGDIDIIASSADFRNSFEWYENNGNEKFVRHKICLTSFACHSISVADLDNDGDKDIVTSSWEYGIVWWENNGRQIFSSHSIDDKFFSAEEVYALDLDEDKHIDIIASSTHIDEIGLWNNLKYRTDDINNLECIDVDAPSVGDWRIEVEGLTVPYGPQPFAVVLSGAIELKKSTLTIISKYGNPSPSGTRVYDIGSSVTASIEKEIKEGDNVRYLCVGWRIDSNEGFEVGSGNSITFYVKRNTVLTWQWKKQYLLKVHSDPISTGIVMPSEAWIDDGATTQILAIPEMCIEFINWSGGISKSENPTTITLTCPLEVYANFRDIAPPPQFTDLEFNLVSSRALKFISDNQRTSGLIDSYTGDKQEIAYTYDQALSLIVLSHAGLTSETFALKAESLANALIGLQITTNTLEGNLQSGYWSAKYDSITAEPLNQKEIHTGPNAWLAYALLYYSDNLKRPNNSEDAHNAAIRFAQFAIDHLRDSTFPSRYDFWWGDLPYPDNNGHYYSAEINLDMWWLLSNIPDKYLFKDSVSDEMKYAHWWTAKLYNELVSPSSGYWNIAENRWNRGVSKLGGDCNIAEDVQSYGSIFYAFNSDYAKQNYSIDFVLDSKNLLLRTECGYFTRYYGQRILLGLEENVLAERPDCCSQTIWNEGSAHFICALNYANKSESILLLNSLVACEEFQDGLSGWNHSLRSILNCCNNDKDCCGGQHYGPEYGLHAGATAWVYFAIKSYYGELLPFNNHSKSSSMIMMY